MAEHDSLPELELRNVRTREQLEETVAVIRRRADVPQRLRLLRARARQRMHRDPTPLVAMMVTAAAGGAAIVGGVLIGRTSAGRLSAAATPALLPVYKPAKTGKDGTYRGAGAFARKPDKLNPREQDKKAWKRLQKKLRKQRARMSR
ncbi:hypothetical protein [Curtobacterium sp. RRHDQ10]|uniref:hypothetical protein n=1 Tax=Curtobacterium phyllosphaerae TaxID=3413379 RepID=UPI003BF3E3AE